VEQSENAATWSFSPWETPVKMTSCLLHYCSHTHTHTHTHTHHRQHTQHHVPSRTKILAPLHFCQIMYQFSQKKFAITNALVFTCLFLLFALEQHKKTKKAKSDMIPHKTKKNGLDTIIGTLNLHFW